jgi:hypothetical protein
MLRNQRIFRLVDESVEDQAESWEMNFNIFWWAGVMRKKVLMKRFAAGQNKVWLWRGGNLTRRG